LIFRPCLSRYGQTPARCLHQPGRAAARLRLARHGIRTMKECESFFAKTDQFGGTPFANFPRPPRVGEQGAAHRHQIKISPVETSKQFIQRAGRRGFSLEAARKSPESPIEPTVMAVYRSAFSPPGKIQIRAGELGLPEAALRTVKDVNPRFRQGNQPGLHLLRRSRKLRGVILKFPLRDAQTNWKVRADGGADGANQFRGESGALRQTLATVTVGALISGCQKNWSIKYPCAPCISTASNPSALASAAACANAPIVSAISCSVIATPPIFPGATKPDGLQTGPRPPAGILGSHHAHMPELRGHDATGCMHLVNHGLPSAERLLAIKTGDVRIIGRRGAVDHRAF